MFKRRLSMFMAAMGVAFSLVACSGAKTADTKSADTSSAETKAVEETTKSEVKSESTDKKNVVVTTSFLQDMVEQLAGDTVNVELIIPAGEDPHLYVAKPEDYTKLSLADLTLYHGLHFEGKMVDALEAGGVAVSKDFPKDRIGTMDEGGEIITDPHFWFDIDLYKMAVEAAATSLENLNPEYKDKYEENKAE